MKKKKRTGKKNHSDINKRYFNPTVFAFLANIFIVSPHDGKFSGICDRAFKNLQTLYRTVRYANKSKALRRNLENYSYRTDRSALV